MPEGEWRCAACVAAPAPRPSVLHPPLVVAGAELRWAETDRYLGVTLSACGGLEREVTARIRQASAAFAVLRPMLEACSSSPSDCVRAAFCDAFSATVSAVMLYGAGVWALPAAELERLEVCQRGMLRAALPRAERRRWAARQQRAPREVLYEPVVSGADRGDTAGASAAPLAWPCAAHGAGADAADAAGRPAPGHRAGRWQGMQLPLAHGRLRAAGGVPGAGRQVLAGPGGDGASGDF